MYCSCLTILPSCWMDREVKNTCSNATTGEIPHQQPASCCLQEQSERQGNKTCASQHNARHGQEAGTVALLGRALQRRCRTHDKTTGSRSVCLPWPPVCTTYAAASGETLFTCRTSIFRVVGMNRMIGTGSVEPKSLRRMQAGGHLTGGGGGWGNPAHPSDEVFTTMVEAIGIDALRPMSGLDILIPPGNCRRRGYIDDTSPFVTSPCV